MERTRRDGGPACPVRSRAARRRTDGDHTPGCSLVPLFKVDGINTRRLRPLQWKNILSAIAATSRFTGAGRLKSMREDMACCLMKLLGGWASEMG